jgi:hypothetical protein
MRRILTTGLIAGAIVIVAFIPVYDRYGSDFFDFYAEHAMPGAWEIAARITLEVWGLAGVLGIGVALLAMPAARKRPPIVGRHLLAWGSMVGIYIIAFFCLPDEAAYLIPAIPFVLLLLWRATPRWAFRVCCGLILLSPFVSMSGVRPAPGLLIEDHRQRVATDASINGFLRFASMVSGSNAYIVGSWKPPIDLLTEDAPPSNAKFIYLVTEADLDQLIAHGWHVWYLPLMREFNYRVYHFDIANRGARDVRELRTDRPGGGR